MKILLLAPQPFVQARGTPLAVKAVVEFLCARGHDVDVLTFHEGEDVVIPGCKIHRIPRLPGVRNIRPGFSFKKVLCDLVMFWECLRMVRHTRYDLIHAVEESVFFAAVVQAITGLPYVYDMDSSLAEQLTEAHPRFHFALGALRLCEAFAVRQSLGVLTVCTALKDLAHRHAPEKPVGLVEDTTLLGDEDSPTERRGAIPAAVAGHPVAMYVGNLEHYQGIDLLLKGFACALHRIPEVHLVIVGGRDGDIGRYRQLATTLGIGAHVHFAGPRPMSALPALLRRADVLVSPRLKGLNTPMKIYSYLDSGTPVLATRLRTHTQVLDDRTAYLVDPDPDALGVGLTELLRDPGLRTRLARRAKAHAQRAFTPEAAQRKLGSFYTTIEYKTAGART